jgi:AcrR family transcriptional regulator
MKGEEKLISHKGEDMTIRQKRTLIYFVEATKQILQRDGFQGLTIRTIAEEAGYNSATLYHYFADLDELILFASVGFLRDYVMLLHKQITPQMTALEKYHTIYRCFNEIAFRYPEIFYNMFFGPRSNNLEMVIKTYYQVLYPEELEGIPDASTRRMLLRGTLFDRDMIIMDELINEGTLQKDMVPLLLDAIISLHERYIHQACLQKGKLDIKAHEQRFEKTFDFILDLAVHVGSEDSSFSGHHK